MSATLPSFSSATPRIVYTTSASACNDEIALILPTSVIGFDQEWKPNRKPGEYHPVTVIQVATRDAAIVYQVGHNTDLPSLLKFVLEDPAIIKVGAGIRDDVKRLAQDWNVRVRGYLCLTELAMRMEPHRWQTAIPAPNYSRRSTTGGKRRPSKRHPDDLTRAEPPGLKRLVAHFLSQSLEKSLDIRCLDWSQPLIEAQIRYAANDALAGHVLFCSMAQQSDPTDLVDLVNTE